MRPTWLFEPDVFGNSADPLKAEIRRQGLVCAIAPQQLLATGSFTLPGGQRLPNDACLISCGSYPFVHFIQSHTSWVPGGWCTAENLDCATYYHHFEGFLLNRRHLIMTGIEAIRQADSIFAMFGRQDEVFVRPSGCQKLFTGRRVNRASFADAIAPSRYDPATLVVIAEPRTISREWRLVVAEEAVIAGSQYLVHGVIDVAPDCPAAVRQFAQEMLTDVKWFPDEIFMMDLCDCDGRLFLLELNGFSSSALYQCDLKTVVAVASELARKAWEQSRTR